MQVITSGTSLTSRALGWIRPLLLLVLFGTAGCDCGSEPGEGTLSLTFITPAPESVLTVDDDLDSRTEGLQIDIELQLSEFDGAGSITLQLGTDDTTLELLSVTGSGTYTFESYTLLDGENELTAVLLNSEGVIQTAATTAYTVDLDVVAEPALSFAQPAQDGLVLSGIDDADNDLSNGLQYDVIIDAENVPPGNTVELNVSGGVLLSSAVNADLQAVFSSVTLPETGPDDTLTLTASTTVGGEDYEASRTVSVVTGACVISIDPEPDADACEYTADSEDEEAGIAGFQTTLTVTTDCSEVTISVGGETYDGETVDGSVGIQVTLDGGINPVTVTATDGADRSGSADFRYFVDTTAPVVTLLEPDPTGSLLITPTQDRDAEAEGIQIDVRGFVGGVEAGTTVTLAIDSEESSTTETGAAGDFRFEDVSFTESGEYDLAISAADACGNEDPEELTLQVIVELAGLVIFSPEDDAVLLGEDDLDPNT
ncbi:MAG: hypothetical protein KC561_02635, partial [Myxococcales bacterium]|nr:hypothetical protein [Myxococcales bacterium]